MDFEFRQTQTDSDSLKNYARLLSRVFPGTGKYTYDFLKWQYCDNPVGPVIGYDAFSGNELAAHYVTIPVMYIQNNRQYKGLLSLNTATDAKFQGKGLFTRLAEKTYELGKNKGYEFVIGVANQNSTHGFIKKLGFKLISPLNAYIYCFDRAGKETDKSLFQSFTNDEIMEWRMKNPENPYLFKNNYAYSKTEYRFIKACLSKTKTYPSRSNLPLSFKMVIGIGNGPQNLLKFKIPDRLKPSPLNLIFKPLGDLKPDIDKKDVYFELIDFDAY